MEDSIEIAVTFEGTKRWLKGVTRYTTCNDVIHALLVKAGCPIPNNVIESFALFESHVGVERMLDGQCAIMSLWQNWYDHELTMRRIDSLATSDANFRSSSKRRRGIRNLFKSKSKKRTTSRVTSRSMNNLYQESKPLCLADDSSFFAQDKNNMLCAFTCSKKKRRGLRERDMNVINAPYEEHPKRLTVVPRDSMGYRNHIFDDVTIAEQKQQQHLQPPHQQHQLSSARPSTSSLNKRRSLSQVSLSSRTSVKHTYVPKRHSCEVDLQADHEPSYMCMKDLGPLTPGRRRLPETVLDWEYESGDSEVEQAPAQYDQEQRTSLINLVMSQKRQIREQTASLNERDRQVQQYEMALKSMRERGKSGMYLQNGDSSPEQHGVVAIRQAADINDFEQICHKIQQLELELQEKKAIAEALTYEIENVCSAQVNTHESHDVTLLDGPFESTRLSPIKPFRNMEQSPQIHVLQSKLQNTQRQCLRQHHQLQELNRSLHESQAEQDSKQRQLKRLLTELQLPGYKCDTMNASSHSHNSNGSSPSKKTKGSDASSDDTSSERSSASYGPVIATRRQIKSLSDLQQPRAPSAFQPSMRRQTSETFYSSRQCLTSSQHADFHVHHAHVIQSQNFTEMSVDVVEPLRNVARPFQCNKTDDVKTHAVDPEVQRITSAVKHKLTPIKEQSDCTDNSCVAEYNNETVDLDSLYADARCQLNPSKMFDDENAEHFIPIDAPKPEVTPNTKRKQVVKLVYDALWDDPELTPEPAEPQMQHTNIADVMSTSADQSVTLPPFGLEAMSKFKAMRLMPSFIDDTTLSGDVIDTTTSGLAPLAVSEVTGPWSTATSICCSGSDVECAQVDTDVTSTSDVNTTLSSHDDTSVWTTLDNAPDGTFTVVKNIPAPVVVLKTQNADVVTKTVSNNSTPADESSLTAVSDLSDTREVSCPESRTAIRQSIAKAIDYDTESPNTPVQPISTVKKRLSFDNEDGKALDNNTAFVTCSLAAMTSLDNSLSPVSVSSMSYESGVGSMQSHDSGNISDTSPTSMCGTSHATLETAV